MQIKPADADGFLARPDPAVRVVLIYGSDDGLVAERMAAFVAAVIGTGADNPFAHVRLEAQALADDPRLLAEEAHSIPFFGGRKAISIRLAGNWSIVPAVELILAAPPVDAWVVIDGGDLRKTSPIRRLTETSRGAAAVPCYADSDRDIDRIIDEEIRLNGLTIERDARNMLRGLVGGDRMQSRSEIRKLCLYALNSGVITMDDVRAVIGDASAFATDEAVDAAALGDATTLARVYRRLVAAGTPGFLVAGAAIRHFDFLHRARAEFEHGATAAEVVAQARPPVFFKRRNDVEKAVALWPLARIERVLAILDRAMIDSRLKGSLSDEVVGQALLMIAALAPTPRRAAAPAGAER